ncbi:IS3 family transposase, partial [Laribacter hongkongensis]|uniref:IS3 family transposase n=3 Tax=Laribacter hongkongensis TaxID=168471 RepID=UPI001EFE305B
MSEVVGRREQPVEAAGGRTGAGYSDAERGGLKKLTWPDQRCDAARQLIAWHGISERRACLLLLVTRKTFRRKPARDCNAALRARLRELAEQCRRFGSPRLHALLRREGWAINHKRVERIYKQEGLSLRLRRRKKRPSHLGGGGG